MFSLDTLLDNVQASKAETLAALDKLGAFELAGAWRVLEPKYAAATFSLMLTSAVAEDWKLDSLPFAAVVVCRRRNATICLASFRSCVCPSTVPHASLLNILTGAILIAAMGGSEIPCY